MPPTRLPPSAWPHSIASPLPSAKTRVPTPRDRRSSSASRPRGGATTSVSSTTRGSRPGTPRRLPYDDPDESAFDPAMLLRLLTGAPGRAGRSGRIATPPASDSDSGGGSGWRVGGATSMAAVPAPVTPQPRPSSTRAEGSQMKAGIVDPPEPRRPAPLLPAGLDLDPEFRESLPGRSRRSPRTDRGPGPGPRPRPGPGRGGPRAGPLLPHAQGRGRQRRAGRARGPDSCPGGGDGRGGGEGRPPSCSTGSTTLAPRPGSNPGRARSEAPLGPSRESRSDVPAAPQRRRPPRRSPPSEDAPAVSDPASGSIRVPSERIDELMDLVSELISPPRALGGPGRGGQTVVSRRRSCRDGLPEPDRRPSGARPGTTRPGGPGRCRPVPTSGCPPARRTGRGPRRPGRGRARRRPIPWPTTAMRSPPDPPALGALPGDPDRPGPRPLPAAGAGSRTTPRGSRGGEVEVVMIGEETGLDRAVQDKAFEPLLHVVRNAVGHGIEPPDERRPRGQAGRGPGHARGRPRGEHDGPLGRGRWPRTRLRGDRGQGPAARPDRTRRDAEHRTAPRPDLPARVLDP